MPDGQPQSSRKAERQRQISSVPAILGADPASARPRHWMAGFGFALLVAAPTLLAASYLTFTAADRYGSRFAFSIRSNQTSTPVEILGAVTQIGNSSVLTDGQVLYDFIRSQQIVETIAAHLPLEAYYNRAPGDWVFSLGHGQPVEDLVDYWNRMVDVSLDPATGILAVEARAFSPTEAQAIASQILAASSDLVRDQPRGLHPRERIPDRRAGRPFAGIRYQRQPHRLEPAVG
jgi:capsular polysaccharide transport system permease protein